MKKIIVVGIVLLIIVSLLIAGCQSEVPAAGAKSASEPSDQEILSQHPDDLDAALAELETVESE